MFAAVFAAGAFTALAVHPGDAAPPPRAAREPLGFVPMYKMLGRKPETSEPWLRAWWVYRDPYLGVAYAVIPKEVPMHVHLDADHVMVVVEGYAHVSVGGARTVMGVGDVVHVPRGMAHSVKRGGVARLVMIDISSPAGDMGQTFWIEEPGQAGPGPAAAKPAPAKVAQPPRLPVVPRTPQ